MEEKLIPSMLNESAMEDADPYIIMDNAAYHSRRIVTKPVLKADIGRCQYLNIIKIEAVSYLEEKGVDLKKKFPSGKYTLKDLHPLLNLVYKPAYVVDRMCNNYGVKVIRLPPYFCKFNPIELAWSKLKRRLRYKNKQPVNVQVTKQMIRDNISYVTPENWKNYEKKVVEAENEEWADVDDHIILGHLQINLDSDSDDEEGVC